MKKVLPFLFICFFIYSFIVQASYAFRMSNDFFIINLGNFNSIAGEASGGNNKLTFTSGELAPGLFTGTNYQICAGFYGGIFCNQLATSSATFTFSVDPTTIDFGTIDPTNPVSRTNTLSVSASTPFTYTVTGREDHPLKNGTAFIPDTTCDTGVCNDSIASLWVNTLTYGFGYRCDNLIGSDCDSSFTTENTFKAFPNSELGKDAQIILNGTTKATGSSATVTYKVNVSASQQPGAYNNTITYIAVPTF